MFSVCSYCNIPVGSGTRTCLVFAHIAIYQWDQEHERVWCLLILQYTSGVRNTNMFGVCSNFNIPVGSETRTCLVFAHIAIYQWGQEHEQVSNLSVSIETNHVEDCHISTGEGSVIGANLFHNYILDISCL